MDSWKLVTISMWVDKLEKDGALKLISETWDWDELWEAAVDLNQQYALMKMEKTIARNQDRGDLKDRVRILGTAVVDALQEMKNLAEPPVFYVTSTSLALVPGVVKDNVHADPAVTARLDSIEKMMENLSKGFTEMKNEQKRELPAIHVNGTPVGAANGGPQYPGGHAGGQSFGGARSRNEMAALPIGGLGLRARSDSRKRKAEEEHVYQQQQLQQHQQEQANGGDQGQRGWNHVVAGGRGRRRPVQYGTSQVKVAGGEAAPYDVFVGNTHPDTTEEL